MTTETTKPSALAPTTQAAYMRAWRKRNPDKVRRYAANRRRRSVLAAMTPEEREAALSARGRKAGTAAVAAIEARGWTMAEIGRRGGTRTAALHDMGAIGRKGGNVLAAKIGREGYQELGRRGAAAARGSA